jgi:hypothetical protein
MQHFLVFVRLIALTAVASGCGATSTAPTSPPAAPTPTIATITPDVGTTGGGTAVTITGTGFTAASTVSFGGAPVIPGSTAATRAA